MKVKIFLALLLVIALTKKHSGHVVVGRGEPSDFPSADLDALLRSSGRRA